jgi:cytochrome c oxidase subunit IV
MSNIALKKSPDAEISSPLAHVVPMKVLAGVFAALVLLTLLTVAAANVDMGSLNLYIALGIAGVKATLVALYFMHLRYDRPFNRIVFLACLLFVVIFISTVLKDTQTYHPSEISGQAEGMKNVHQPFGQ